MIRLAFQNASTAQVKVRITITKQDLRDSPTFNTKREADVWRARRWQKNC